MYSGPPALIKTANGAGVGAGLALGEELGEALGDALGEALGEELGTVLGEALGAALGPALEGVLGLALGEVLGASLISSVGGALSGEIAGEVLGEVLGDALGEVLGEVLGAVPTHTSRVLTVNELPLLANVQSGWPVPGLFPIPISADSPWFHLLNAKTVVFNEFAWTCIDPYLPVTGVICISSPKSFKSELAPSTPLKLFGE